MNDEIKEVLDYYKKDIEEKWNWLQSINFKYGDEKYIQRVKNHKILLDYITNLEQKSYKDDVIITKAIEYIKSHSNNLMFELRIEEMEDLLNILTENAPQENLYRYTPEKGFELVGDDND